MLNQVVKKNKALTKNIVLIGMMGSGKTIVGQALAQRLKCPLLSTDALIVAKAKRPISEIVAKDGWECFRQLEHKIVVQAAKKKGIVIDCGGGVVLDPLNLEHLKKNGIIFYLKASPSVIYKRIKGDQNRPLVHVPNPLAQIKKIYKERLPLYNQADHVILTNDPSIDSVIVQILAKV